MQQEQKDLLQELYENNRDAFYKLILSMGVPECEVDDIIQDTFCSFMRKYGEVFLEWNIAQKKSVLTRILKNRCVDYFRNWKRKGVVSMDSEDFDMEYNILRHHVGSDICDILIENEEMEQIYAGIQEMKSTLRGVAVLHIVEGRPIKEVCEILHINRPTCNMRIMRARKYLRKLFNKMH